MSENGVNAAKLLQDGTPIRRRKLASDVLDRLLGLINGGTYAPGDLLPSERQLMELFEIGRPAIREALQDLQRMGLIVINHGEGARVVSPTARSILDQIAGTARHLLHSSPENLDHLKDARLFFEVGMARLAAARATADHLAALRRYVDVQREVGDDLRAFMKADLNFHRTIATVSGNPIFVATSEAMLEWLAEYHASLVTKEGREARTIAEHSLILERIAGHDVEGAAAAMMAHLTRAHDLYDTARKTDSNGAHP
jgi:DNA-binding FadR family transcriptional regulator